MIYVLKDVSCNFKRKFVDIFIHDKRGKENLEKKKTKLRSDDESQLKSMGKY